MNKRAIVNVATGEFYCKMQSRLTTSLLKSVDEVLIFSIDLPDYKTSEYAHEYPIGIDLLLWHDCLPKGSRLHSESPYGFKVHAIKAAYEKGYTSILWLDSPAHAVKEDISPIFDKIEKEGYYVMSHVDPLENWVGDSALFSYRLFREDLIGKNLPSGSCYGFNMLSANGYSIFEGMKYSESDGYFKSERISDNGWHRHDEAILALNLITYNLPVFTFDPLFQSDSPYCVIKSGGEW